MRWNVGHCRHKYFHPKSLETEIIDFGRQTLILSHIARQIHECDSLRQSVTSHFSAMFAFAFVRLEITEKWFSISDENLVIPVACVHERKQSLITKCLVCGLVNDKFVIENLIKIDIKSQCIQIIIS